MFKFIEIKKEIREYKIIGNNCFYKKNEKFHYLYSEGLIVDEDNHGFFSFDSYYGLNHNGSTDLIDLTSSSKITIPTTFLGTDYFDNNFIISKDSIREGVGLYSSKYVICQLFPFKELYELPHRYYGSGYRFKNKYFQIQNEKMLLRSLSLLTGEYEWEVDFGEYGEIRNILGVVEDELYVWLGNTTLVAINIQNGVVQWYINTYETHQMGFDTGVHLLADERKVVLFYETNYVEIDLQAQNSKLLLKNTFGRDWVFSANTVVGNYIYFVGRNYATQELSVGAFNRQSLQVEWYYASPEWQGTVPDDYEGNAVVLGSAPQVSDNKLYVLENGTGTLYIFEREDE